VTIASPAELRSRLYERYATQHVGCGGDEAAEHLTKPEILQTFDDVATALAPGGVFVGRVPNAISPLGGHIRDGDYTHQTSFTARSIRQLAAAAGFDSVLARSSPPIAHGLVSAARMMIWQLVSACYRIDLAAETGLLRGHRVTQNLTFVARKETVTVKPRGS
jgi:hypothetical protein